MAETNELNLEQKVTVRSIAGWTTGFARRADGIGDITIAPNGSIRLSRNEIITQVQNGNKLLSGLDGLGSHATLIIDDAPTRVECGFESEDGKTKQTVFSEEVVTEIFKVKPQASFEKAFKELIRTRAEKYAVIDFLRKGKINDYQKIRFAENYTGFRL